ncbi:protein unc-93 homolog A-like [Glandiceps talaboti]
MTQNTLHIENVQTKDSVELQGHESFCQSPIGWAPVANEETDSTDSVDDTINPTRLERTVNTMVKKTEQRFLWKNVICFSISFVCLFSGYVGLEGLQSSINCVEGLGLASLVTLYSSYLVSGLFLPPLIIGWLGNRLTLISSMCCFVIYTIANFYPHWYTMIPASLIIGIGSANIWTAMPSYLSTLGHLLAEVTGKRKDLKISKVISIFYGAFSFKAIIGFIFQSVIYGRFADYSTNDTSMMSEVNEDSYTCGAIDCQQTKGNVTTYCNPPDQQLTYILLGVYATLGLTAVGIMIFFVDDLKNPDASTDKLKPFKKLGATIKLWINYKMVLLIPMALQSGFQMTVFWGDFPKVLML